MKGKYENNQGTWKKTLLIVLCCILAVLLVGVAALYIWMDSLLNGIDRFDDKPTCGSDQLDDLIDPTDVDPTIGPADAIPTGKNVINILLVGQDRREGENRMHSDAMILCTINKTTKTFTMTSFMRDMWVYIPDHYNERINVPYMVGGFDLLNETLDYNFGISADYNVEIDFSGFMSAIDLVGGIDIELTAAEARYLNRRGNWDVEENQGWNLTEGVNHLTGSQALAYSRIREIGDDFERTSRQRTVLTVLINKAKGLSLTKLYELARGVIPMLTTDMTNPQIMGLILEVIPLLPDLQIVSQRIPADGEYHFANKSGASVIELSPENFEASKELLAAAMKEAE